MMGIELMTSSLPRMRSTPELHRQSLERGRRIELPFPAWKAGIIAIIRTPHGGFTPFMVGKDGFEPPKVKPADLQSAPFGHSGTCPYITDEPMEGFEPTTPRLQITCSGHLSYIGNAYFKVPNALWDCKDRNYFLSSKQIFNLFSMPSLSRPHSCNCTDCLACGVNLSGTPSPSALAL